MNDQIRSFRNEKILLSTGMAGFITGLFCFIYIVYQGGSIVPPEGDIFKAISFNFAIGLFAFTTAFLMPFVNFSKGKGNIFRFSVLITFLIAIFIETFQNMRGIDPRFTSSTEPLDQIVGSMFGLDAMLIILTYLFFTWQVFRPSTLRFSPNLGLGIRYGMLSTLVSFAAGIWISTLSSRYTGIDGNIIWLHGLGFHGVQLIPFMVWLLGKSRIHDQKSLIHVTGILWLIIILSIGVQTYVSQSIFELSPIMITAYISTILCFILISYVLYHVLQVKKDVDFK
ncbi:hypothetical protein [Chengkuizengella sediminis]|uniref:hypothetical protein n=1 Tax=Chengkuizengella sediminis TaxID=1885917 RepID=UPI00138A20E3|nr:hypothetical protein [Chengkuizengella sediminis]NDI36061.1 hypothetical protein [Chengkuizengella sediminis]